MDLIFTVNDIFHLKDRGTVIVSQLPERPVIKIGDRIKIINPDDTKIYSQIMSIDGVTRQCFSPEPVHTFGVLLESHITVSAIISGAKVYLVD